LIKSQMGKEWSVLMEEMESLRQMERDQLEITDNYRFSQGRCDILKFIVSLDEIADKVINSLGTRKDTPNIYK
jgi:ABC-type anion transport system duplicated permease subunit